MKTPPDIYAENPVVDLDYKIAVMQAHRDGKRAHCKMGRGSWFCCPAANFNWEACIYRIDPACKPQPPKIAEGHNPERLTEDQVGVKDGWRLLTPEEIRYRKSSAPVETSDAQTLRKNTLPVHWETYPVYGSNICTTYRTQKPAGFFLPKPKVKVPLALREYLGASLWFRPKDNHDLEAAAILISFEQDRVHLHTDNGHGKIFTPTDLSNAFEYSTDRVNWKPCYKEVE